MSQQLNFQSLEDFVQREPDDISTIQVWYEKLSEYELDGSESQKDVDTLLYALRYLMNYSFTAAEELKEVAEREAVAMAEKEEKWEEQRQLMREEIEDLRQRITVGADATESSEAYVAQIDSLKEENRILQQLSRDRDMEMADQRDRFEALVSRADQLTRERDALMDHKAQMEDTVRELNRRISSKSEEASNEWETKKLKLRNEQAVTLSKQMQAVVSQNDQLRSEVERVSDALEDATRLIEDSSRRIAELAEELRLSQKKEIQMNNENKTMKEKFESVTQTLEEMEAKAMDSDEILKNKIQQQTEMIGDLQQKLYESQVEVEELRGRIRADTTEEKEAELEKLKQELITATKMARSLLGQETSSKGEPTETTDWPRRLMLAEHRLQEAQNKIDMLKKTTSELEDTIVMKEDANKDTAAELERLRETKFGSAREELEHLGQQLKMREEQIAKLTRHCTLLQIELGRCAEKTTEQKRRKESAKERETREEEEERVEEREKKEERQVEEIVERKEEEEERISIERKSSPTEEEEQKKSRRAERTKQRSRGEYEQQAMIIAGLNFELMMLMEELETKNNQLVEMEHILTESKRKADEGRGKLKLAYEEVSSLRRKSDFENQDSEEESKTELAELKRFAESVKIGGTELERRAEEVTRKLIAEKIERIKLSRSEKSLRFRCARATDAAKKLREKLIGTRQQTGRQNARLQYELDITCFELASVQNKLLHSVSMKQFEDLSRKYREIVKRETVGGGNIQDTPLVDFDIRKGAPEEDPNELSAKNKYLKKMVEILTDQNEFWSNETEILQKENEELKKFLEDMENESDSRTVLVSIESRLMETIRELSEMAKEHAREHRKMRDAEETLAKQKIGWHAERKHFVHVISMLKQAYHTQRNNNLATVTVAQMESLRDRIVEIGEDCERAKEERNSAERVREQLEIQLINTKSLKKARDLIEMERADMQRLERALRDAFSAERVQTAKVERLQNLLRSKERAETQRNEELEELRRHNEELIALVGSGGTKKIVKETVMESQRQEERRREIEKEPESEYEMDFDSSESTSSSNSERPRMKSIMEGDGKESSEKRLARIKETAETIIRSYREQLAQKDSAIEGYRELLLAKINEVSSVPKEKEIREDGRAADGETEERLRQTIHENARLRGDIEELEAANRNLYRERRKSVIPTVFHTGTQTEEDDHSTVIYSPAPQRGIITPIPEETERTQIRESMEKDINLTLKHKNEINRLQERIRRLTTTNKNLLIACERIKEEAMTQLAAKSKREERRENEENSQERVENLKLRTEVVNMRKKLKESQERAERLAKEVELNKKNAQEEIWKWEQRKRTEESILTLRKKLKETEEREEDLKNRLKRREKRLEEMGMESEERRKEMERIQRRLTETKTEREKIQKESQQMELIKEKEIVLEKKLKEREKELSTVNGKLRENEQRNKQLTAEILSLKKTFETKKRNESLVRKTREKETKTVEKEEIKENQRMEEEMKEMKKKLRLTELRHQEALERMEILEKDLEKSQSDCERLMKRLSIREENSSSGAVAVLRDKLNAKEREISQLKTQITQLERRLSR